MKKGKSISSSASVKRKSFSGSAFLPKWDSFLLSWENVHLNQRSPLPCSVSNAHVYWHLTMSWLMKFLWKKSDLEQKKRKKNIKRRVHMQTCMQKINNNENPQSEGNRWEIAKEKLPWQLKFCAFVCFEGTIRSTLPFRADCINYVTTTLTLEVKQDCWPPPPTRFHFFFVLLYHARTNIPFNFLTSLTDLSPMCYFYHHSLLLFLTSTF